MTSLVIFDRRLLSLSSLVTSYQHRKDINKWNLLLSLTTTVKTPANPKARHKMHLRWFWYITIVYLWLKKMQGDFDIPHKVLRFRQTAFFLGNMLSLINLEFSYVQMGQFLRLILGLDFLPPHTDEGNCLCGKANDASGHHRLNCSRWAGSTRTQWW